MYAHHGNPRFIFVYLIIPEKSPIRQSSKKRKKKLNKQKKMLKNYYTRIYSGGFSIIFCLPNCRRCRYLCIVYMRGSMLQWMNGAKRNYCDKWLVGKPKMMYPTVLFSVFFLLLPLSVLFVQWASVLLPIISLLHNKLCIFALSPISIISMFIINIASLCEHGVANEASCIR